MMISMTVVDGVRDIEVVDGLVVLVEGEEELRQHIEMRLELWRGEVFYDLDEGPDYADLILPALDPAEGLGDLRRVVMGTPGVTDARLSIVAKGPGTLTIQGSYIGNLELQNDMIRGEFGPVQIG